MNIDQLEELRLFPEVVELPNITVNEVIAGDNHTLVLTDEGRIYSWGYNNMGQCGIKLICSNFRTPFNF